MNDLRELEEKSLYILIARNVYSMLHLQRGLFRNNRIPVDMFARIETLNSRKHIKRLNAMRLSDVFDVGYSRFDQIFWQDRSIDRMTMIGRIFCKRQKRIQIAISSLFKKLLVFIVNTFKNTLRSKIFVFIQVRKTTNGVERKGEL